MADWGSLAPWLADNTDVFTTPTWREREAAQTAAALGLAPAKSQAPQKPQMLDDARGSDFVSNMFRNASATGMAKGLYESGKSGVTLPHDAYTGEIDLTTPEGKDEGIKRSMDLGLTLPLANAVPLSIAGGIERGALGVNAPGIAKQKLVPVLRSPEGEIKYGKPGDAHYDVAMEHDLWPNAENQGFAVPGGPFMDRSTAFDWLKQNEAQSSANLKKNVWSGKLEANDLRTAREAAEGTYPVSPPLKGMPLQAEVPGFGSLAVGPNPTARAAAENYMKKAGMPYNPERKYVPVDPERAARVAQEFEKMPHAPNDPEVANSYNALINETKAQFDAMPKDLKIEFIKPDMKDPYAASPRLVQKDIAENNHMWVYPTESGFGKEGFDPSGNPMLGDSGVTIDGRRLANNDLFRIVHDYFGHAKEGVGFRATGEDNAFRQHRAMFSPAAQRALTTETRGQNSWLNYGPQGAKNRTAKTEDTVFADQKVGLMPQWTTLYANKGAAPLSLVVARKMEDGTVQYGKPGQMHGDLIDRENFSTNGEWGFAQPGGRFLTRQEAADWVAQNQPAAAKPGGKPLEAGGYKRRLKAGGLFANSKQAAPLSLAAAVSDDIPFDMPIKTGSGKQTVLNPVRNEFPGIYGDPREIAREAASRVAPEDPALKQLFGVTRDDLYEIGERGTRPGNMEPSFAQAAGRSKQAQQVMTPENAERIRNVLFEGEKYPELVKGMDSWYVMDPAFKRLEELVGTEEAIKRYNSLNTYMSMASPGSEVLTEINRGSGANFMATQGRFDDFEKFGGIAESMRRRDFPRDLREIVSHPYHKTAHAGPMRKYHDSGKVEMQSAKVPLYMQASGVPQTGFQTKLPVPDAHFTRALGVPDVRTAEVTKNASMKPAIYTPIGPWYRDNVAHPLGIEPVPAQARQWGLFAPQTGVDTPIGAPKLELIARRIAEQAKRRGIDPERLRDEVLLGKNLAVNPAELAPFSLGYAGERD